MQYIYQPHPSDPSNIKITNVVMSLPSMAHKLALNEIALHSNNYVGYYLDYEKMSRIIENILLRIPLPVFYLDVSNPTQWLLIDGFHRINAIKMFMENQFILQNMEVLVHLNGYSYQNLDGMHQRIFHDTQIITYQVEAQTPLHLREVIFKKIRDMNAY